MSDAPYDYSAGRYSQGHYPEGSGMPGGSPPPLLDPVPARASLAASVRGPVLLIALGSLFALDYMAGISIARTWPAILIIAGLFRLFEHLGARS